MKKEHRILAEQLSWHLKEMNECLRALYDLELQATVGVESPERKWAVKGSTMVTLSRVSVTVVDRRPIWKG